MAFRGGEAIGAEGDLVVTLVGQNVVDEAQTEYADKCTSGLEVYGATLRFEARARCARRVRSAASCTWLLVIDGCLVEGRVDGRGMNDASVAGVRGATVTVRGGAHVVAASSGSGEDCRFFCVRLRWPVCRGRFFGGCDRRQRGRACESGSLTLAQFVTPVGGAFGTARVMDAGGTVAQHVVIEPTVVQAPAGETQLGTDGSAGGNPAGVTKPGSEEKLSDEIKPSEDPALTPDPSHEHDVKPALESAKTPATKTAKKTKPASTSAAALPKTGDGDWAVACLAFVFLGMLLVTVKVRALR